VHEPIDALGQRIDDLTRQVRWHRRILVILVTLGVGVFLTGQAPAPDPPDELRARRFALTDRAGAVRGTWSLEPDETVLLQLVDPRGPQRLSLSLGVGGPSAVLLAPDGKRSASLTVGAESPRLVLSDKQGAERLWLALRNDSPALQFFDAGHVARSGLTTFNDDRGVAVVSESVGTSHGLILYGKNRDIVWSAP
jgi:hypothetical protein